MDIQQYLDLANILKQVGDKALGDKDFQHILFKEAAFKQPFSIPSNAFNFLVDGNATIEAKLFNSLDDLEGESEPEKDIAFKGYDPEEFLKENVLIGYRFNGYLKGSGSSALGQLGFGTEFSKDFTMFIYRKHAINSTLVTATARDLTSFFSVFGDTNPSTLDIGETMGYQLNGGLKAAASIEWAHIMTIALKQLSKVLKLDEALNLQTGFGAQAKAHIEIKDNLTFLVSKEDSDKIRVTIDKVKEKGIQLNGNFGLDVSLANPEELEEKVTMLLDAALKTSSKKIEQGLQYAEDQIPADYQSAIDIACLVMGWDIQAGKDYIMVELTQLKEKVQSIIETVLKVQLSLGLKLEMSRTGSSKAYFDASMTEADWKRFSGNLIKLNLEEVWQAIESKEAPDVEVHSYLKMASTKISNSFGFRIAVGNFELSAKLAYKDSEIVATEQLNPKTGKRAHELHYYIERGRSVDAKNDRHAYFRFSAETPMPLEAQPSCKELDYGLMLQWSDTQKRVSKDEVAKYVDWAATWNLLPSHKVHETIARLYESHQEKENIQFLCKLSIEEGDFERFFPLIVNASDHAIAKSLAASLPYLPEFESRLTPETRILNYFGYAQLLLKQNPRTEGDVLVVLQHGFSQASALSDRTRNWEAQNAETPSTADNGYYSMAGQFSHNFVWRRVNGFKKDVRDLQHAIEAGKTYEKHLNKSGKKLNDIIGAHNNPFNYRFLGRLLIDIAAEHQMEDLISSELSIIHQDSGSVEVLIK
ncbi:hypothetical protein V6R21_07090 [Limibacter armeniacum]|uniref:hypothetical protein n=1 Tax=Limibacter armeniacum TaxID=466084 RepID=UPI002FE5672A